MCHKAECYLKDVRFFIQYVLVSGLLRMSASKVQIVDTRIVFSWEVRIWILPTLCFYTLLVSSTLMDKAN